MRELLSELEAESQRELLNAKRVNNLLRLIHLVIFDCGKGREEDSKPLDSLHNGEPISFELRFPIRGGENLFIPANKTVLELRQLLQKQKNFLQKKHTFLINQKPINNKGNSMTFKQYRFCSSNVIQLRSTFNNDLNHLIGGELKPGLIRCLRIIFNTFHEGGVIPFERALEFVSFCLTDRRRKEVKTRELFFRHNADNDDLLKLQELLNFYTDAAEHRPFIVQANLRTFLVQDNDRFMDDSDDEDANDITSTLAKQPHLYSIIFTFLENPLTFSNAHELLNLLPVERLLWNEIENANSTEKMERVFLCKTLG